MPHFGRLNIKRSSSKILYFPIVKLFESYKAHQRALANGKTPACLYCFHRVSFLEFHAAMCCPSLSHAKHILIIEIRTAYSVRFSSAKAHRDRNKRHDISWLRIQMAWRAVSYVVTLTLAQPRNAQTRQTKCSQNFIINIFDKFELFRL